MGRTYLVTGGAGFIGSNFIRYLADKEPSADIINLDLLTYAGVEATVAELDTLDRHRFVQGDIRDASAVLPLVASADVVVNFAAESHVDRSIADPSDFISSNVAGTGVLLDAARRCETPRFVHVSTDEVYGPVMQGAATEVSHLYPSSPYAASKAAADLLVASYRHTYGYEAIITRCSNNYGPYQFPEKLVSLAITRLLDNRPVPLYGDGLQQRDWLWVIDHCAALHLLVDDGVAGEIYNIASGRTIANRTLAEHLMAAFGKEDVIELVADRPGHDRRYALDASKLRSLGWEPAVSVEEGLARTVDWYRNRADWWQPLVLQP
jgi:dTDP-glucose 4,6-dehydratase